MTKQAPNIYPTNEKKRKLDLISHSPKLMQEASHYLVCEKQLITFKRSEDISVVCALHEIHISHLLK